MNKRHQWLLPWGFQIAGWVLIALTLIFPIFVMLTWQSIDFGSVFDKFPYGGILIMLYLGSGLIVFSREKVEDEYIGTIRTESVVISAYAAGLWFILINLLAGAVPAVSQAMNASRIPYAYDVPGGIPRHARRSHEIPRAGLPGRTQARLSGRMARNTAVRVLDIHRHI